MMIEHTASKSILAGILTAMSVAIPAHEFVAGLLMAVGGYFAGRSIWKEIGTFGLWAGLLVSQFLAVAVAMVPSIVPVEAPVQAKMMLMGFAFVPVAKWIENRGNKLAEKKHE